MRACSQGEENCKDSQQSNSKEHKGYHSPREKRASLLLVRASLCSGQVCGGSDAVASRGSSRSEHCPCWPTPLSWRRVLTVPHTHLCSRKAGVSVPRLASQVLLSEALPTRSPRLPSSVAALAVCPPFIPVRALCPPVSLLPKGQTASHSGCCHF